MVLFTLFVHWTRNHLGEGDVGAARQGGREGVGEPAHVEERGHVQVDISRSILKRRDLVHRLGQQRRVAQQRAFGRPGAAWSNLGFRV